ncbi:hypothetical protein JCM10908_006077 [Rhodotorula pacifica]|uniref:Cox15p n=1 Tax=Rhodotorula pacifica TaxID=1495444 RepID=UPI003178ABC2
MASTSAWRPLVARLAATHQPATATKRLAAASPLLFSSFSAANSQIARSYSTSPSTCTCASPRGTAPAFKQLRPGTIARGTTRLATLATSTRSFSSSRSALSAVRLLQDAVARARIQHQQQRRPQSTIAVDPSAPSASTSETSADPPEVPLTTPLVSKYLFMIAGLVFAIVVVGGMTRLTESGLSITEWNVVKGVKLPMTREEWEVEFDKYKNTPEWKINNQHITLEDFKTIYKWEWAHRILGRIIGVTFLAPIPYFAYTRQLGRGAFLALFGIASLIGGQGALGWYMVKSGLDEKSVQELGGVPRVSQYRLAAHLGMAFLVYSACLRFGLGAGRDWKLARKVKGLAGWKTVEETVRGLQSKTVGRTRALVTLVTALVFTTALSGAFVAGLDAGLIYNEWPLMGGKLHPPSYELNKDFYCRKEDKSDRWRNVFENPTTVQFDHRMLAYTTFASIVSLFLYARRPHIRSQLPPTTYRLIKGTLHMSLLQIALGISTLLYLVPIHLAATHQAGSLVLLSLAIATGASVRRPSSRVVQEAMRMAKLRNKAAQIKV